jgi:SAM-dependent methyltransferase
MGETLQVKACLRCHMRFESLVWGCPSCGYCPVTAQGFLSFTKASSGDGFRPEFFADLASRETGNFWFRARNRLIVKLLRRYFPDMESFLEVGCGTGYVLSGIAVAFPSLHLSGSEYFCEGLPFAARRVPRASLCQIDARALPFYEEFDAIGAFDVLEHIAEDQTVLGQIYQALRPGGGLILTVPQHPWLWSTTDERACHLRRYRADELRDKVRAAGFNVRYTTSFVTLLLPFMLVSRLGKCFDRPHLHKKSELQLNSSLNHCFGAIMRLEYAMLCCGVRFPAGGSLVLVGEKPR